MKIAVACDHGGLNLKKAMIAYVEKLGHEVKDFGCDGTASVNYPDYAHLVCKAVQDKEAELGILVCGTGIGISMAANKVSGIRCALVSNEYSAEMTKRHNNANMLAFGGRVIGSELAKNIVDAYIEAEFEGGRHQNRIDKISAMEG